MTSYKTTIYGTKIPVSWTATYSATEDGTYTSTRPTWLTQFSVSSGSAASESQSAPVDVVTATVPQQSFTSTSDITPTLRANNNNVSNYDLSTHDYNGNTTSINTANCYAINKWGTFKIPLVFGNAIKNGQANIPAYHNTTTTADANVLVLNNFIDYQGNPIYRQSNSNRDNTSLSSNKDPYIWDHYSITDAWNVCIVWQDSPSLIDVSDANKPHLSSDKRYIEFTVPQSHMCEGNSIIALRDADDNVVWSWHIWITSNNLANTIQVTDGTSANTYDFMPCPLGMCYEDERTYSERNYYIKVTQSGSTNTSIVPLTQTSGTNIHFYSNCVVYEWGNKNPYVGNEGYPGSGDKPTYDRTYTHENMLIVSENESVYYPILYPAKYFITSLDGVQSYGYMGWCSKNYVNLWDATINDDFGPTENVNDKATKNAINKVVKTVYDPMPVGFVVPPVRAFTVFFKDATLTTTHNTNVAANAVSATNGLNFYVRPNKQGTTIFFPGFGHRTPRGEFAVYQGGGAYWTSTCGNIGKNGTAFRFSTANITVNYAVQEHTADGNAIIGIKE